MRNIITAIPCFVFLLLISLGCQLQQPERSKGYETLMNAPNRDTDTARQYNSDAVRLLKNDRIEEAENELKAALAADLFFGPAHNNLGIVYFKQKKLYLAAWEFQYAAKLMPNQPKPQNNLGMIFEAIGRLDEAAKCYDKALALKPEAVEIIANLARVYVRTDRKDEETRQLLSKIVIKDTRPEWVAWARHRLAFLGQPKSFPLTAPPSKIRTLTDELE